MKGKRSVIETDSKGYVIGTKDNTLLGRSMRSKNLIVIDLSQLDHSDSQIHYGNK